MCTRDYSRQLTCVDVFWADTMQQLFKSYW